MYALIVQALQYALSAQRKVKRGNFIKIYLSTMIKTKHILYCQVVPIKSEIEGAGIKNQAQFAGHPDDVGMMELALEQAFKDKKKAYEFLAEQEFIPAGSLGCFYRMPSNGK